MIIRKLRLKNFIGIFAGTGQTEITIDFPENDNKITMLSGKNGSGKTTILSQLQPYKDSMDDRKDLILPGTDGEKEIWYEDSGHTYKIQHYYGKKPASFFQKDGAELNDSGSVRLFEDVVTQQLGLTKDYFSIGRLGSNMKNFIELPTMQRKNYIMGFIEAVQKYSDAHVIVASKLNVLSKQMTQMTTTYKQYDDIDKIQQDMKTMEQDLAAEQQTLFSDNSSLAMNKASLSSVSADLSKVSFTDVKRKEADLESQHLAYASGNEKFVSLYGNMPADKCTAQIATLSGSIKNITSEASAIGAKIDLANSYITESSNTRLRYSSLISKLAVSDTASLLKQLTEAKAVVVKHEETLSHDEAYAFVSKDIRQSLSYLESLSGMLQAMINAYAVLNKKADGSDVPYYEMIFTNGKQFMLDMTDRIAKQSKLLAEKQEKLISYQKYLDGLDCEYTNKSSGISCGASSGSDNEKTLDSIKAEMDSMRNTIAVTNKDISALKEDIDHLNDDYFQTSTVVQQINNADTKHNTVFQYFKTKYGRPGELLSMPFDHLKQVASNIRDDIEGAADAAGTLVREKETESTINNQYIASVQIDSSRKSYQDEIDRLDLAIASKKSELVSLQSEAVSKKKALDDASSAAVLFQTYLDGLLKDSDVVSAIHDNKAVLDKYESDSKTSSLLSQQISMLNTKVVADQEKIKELTSASTKLRSTEMVVAQLKKDITDITVNYNDCSVIEKILNPKNGIPKVFLQAYLGNVESVANDLLHVAYGDKFSIHFDLTASDFFIRVNSGANSISDILLASQGETALTVISLSLALIEKAIGNYKILSLDEIDGPLDSYNRDAFINILTKQIIRLGIQQVFVISHNNSFDVCPMNLILLPGSAVNDADSGYMQNKTIVADFR